MKNLLDFSIVLIKSIYVFEIHIIAFFLCINHLREINNLLKKIFTSLVCVIIAACVTFIGLFVYDLIFLNFGFHGLIIIFVNHILFLRARDAIDDFYFNMDKAFIHWHPQNESAFEKRYVLGKLGDELIVYQKDLEDKVIEANGFIGIKHIDEFACEEQAYEQLRVMLESKEKDDWEEEV